MNQNEGFSHSTFLKGKWMWQDTWGTLEDIMSKCCGKNISTTTTTNINNHNNCACPSLC